MMNVLARSVATRSLGQQTRGLTTAASRAEFSKVWLAPKEAWPIFAITTGALAFAAYKLNHDANAPDTHFNKAERRTLNYFGDSPRDAKRAIEWGNSAFHSGPSFAKN